MIKSTIYILLSIICLSFIKQDTYSVNILIGKGKPTLFGLGFKLKKEAQGAFLAMQKDALKSGIQIEVVSSYRSYDHQKRIWSNKYKRYISRGLSPEKSIQKIIEYSTIPGTSRHHWGTDIDIVDGAVPRPESVLESDHFEGKGVFVKMKKWLDLHASEYGFCLVYTNQEGRKGFKYEPWHYSYKPISKLMLADYRKIDIQSLLKKDSLLGSDFFTVEFINRYIAENILDINPDLK